MLTNLGVQVVEFVLTALLGMLSTAVLHFHQQILKYSRLQGVLLWVWDLVVWIFLIILVFASLLLINQGNMRFYILLALFTGGIVYLVFLKPYLTRSINRLARVVVMLVTRAITVIMYPFLRLAFLLRRRPPNGGEPE